MGRTVVGDEKQLEAQVDRIFGTGKAAQVGLLIGKLGNATSRDVVFALAPTPMNDDGVPPSLEPNEALEASQGGPKKGSKGKPEADSPLPLSTDWVGEHARQVKRMLVGGMYVIGVYVFCSEGVFKSSMAVLWQAVMTVAALTPQSPDSISENLLLHISSSPRRFSCRSCPISSTYSPNGLRPCEWKLGKLLSNLQEFSCIYNVDISYPVKVEGTETENSSLKNALFSAIDYEAGRLRAAQAVVDGSLVDPDKQLGPGTLDHAVEFLLPVEGGVQIQSTESEVKIAGSVSFEGNIHARAYGSVREPLTRAVDGLKEDIIASLKSRLELLIDEAEQAADDAKYETPDSTEEVTPDAFLMNHLRSNDHRLIMPRRVFVPWVEGAMISDYMLPDENLQDVQEHLTDLFGVEQKVETSDIIEPEKLGVVSINVVPPAEVRPTDANRNGAESLKSEKPKPLASTSQSRVPFTYIGAGLALLIAILLSIFFLSR